MIKRSALPKGIIIKLIDDTKLVRTFPGCLKTKEAIMMQDLRLPKFDKNRCINQHKVFVFDNDNVKYNIILGTNFLSKTGIKYYSEGNMEWFDCSIPLCPPGGSNSKVFDAMEDMFHIQVEDELFGEDLLKCFATKILDAKYEKTDVVEVMKQLTHLNAHQKNQTCLSATGEQKDRGSSPENDIFSNGPKIISECSNLLYQCTFDINWQPSPWKLRSTFCSQ
jgi:hypothetical protein